MNQPGAFIDNLELSLYRRYKECNDGAATPSSILLAVLNAVADAKVHLRDQEPSCPEHNRRAAP